MFCVMWLTDRTPIPTEDYFRAVEFEGYGTIIYYFSEIGCFLQLPERARKKTWHYYILHEIRRQTGRRRLFIIARSQQAHVQRYYHLNTVISRTFQYEALKPKELKELKLRHFHVSKSQEQYYSFCDREFRVLDLRHCHCAVTLKSIMTSVLVLLLAPMLFFVALGLGVTLSMADFKRAMRMPKVSNLKKRLIARELFLCHMFVWNVG